MLDRLIVAANNKLLTDTDIREEVDTFLFQVSSYISFTFKSKQTREYKYNLLVKRFAVFKFFIPENVNKPIYCSN